MGVYPQIILLNGIFLYTLYCTNHFEDPPFMETHIIHYHPISNVYRNPMIFGPRLDAPLLE